MKILYHSATPWAGTGYGRVTRELATRLHNSHHEVYLQCMSAIQSGAIQWHGEIFDGDEWVVPVELDEPMMILPSTTQRTGDFGVGSAETHFDSVGADLYFTHFDSWMESTRDKIPSMGVPYASYVIVDHYPAPDPVIRQVMNATEIVSMSKFAKRSLREKGVPSTQIPHAVHTDRYYPYSEGEKPDAIKWIDDEGTENATPVDDRFVFGMVSANHGDRKNIPNQMEAFKMFLDEVDDTAVMYIHTEQTSNQGYDLRQIQQEIGIPDENILWADISLYRSIGDQTLNRWYNVFDVLMNCSMGESWGLAVTESMAAGTPVIATAFSTMPEQLGVTDFERDTTELGIAENNRIMGTLYEAPHGLLVSPATHLWREKVSAKHYLTDPRMIFHAMQYYYDNPELVEIHGEEAREHVVNNYDWEEHVVPDFIDLFDRLEELVT